MRRLAARVGRALRAPWDLFPAAREAGDQCQALNRALGSQSLARAQAEIEGAMAAALAAEAVVYAKLAGCTPQEALETLRSIATPPEKDK